MYVKIRSRKYVSFSCNIVSIFSVHFLKFQLHNVQNIKLKITVYNCSENTKRVEKLFKLYFTSNLRSNLIMDVELFLFCCYTLGTLKF